MTFDSTSLIQVCLKTRDGAKSVGRLALKNRKIFFEYSAEFIQSGLELSPFKLPLRTGIHSSEDLVFEGLFGLFNDSLPDGWGRLLLDRKLRQLGVNPGDLSPLDRLRYVGSRGMGALTYAPEIDEGDPLPHQHLDKISEEIKNFSENEVDHFVDDLLAMNGSSGGARPKIVIAIEEEDWIVKFSSSVDPKDIGPIEFAYHLMALDAGLDVPEAKLFPSKKGPGYFGVKRFDREGGKRTHMHTLSGLIHADHRLPSLDYDVILRATITLTKDAGETEKQFRACVFNVLTHNRDDHAKNFSFLMDNTGRWRVSPAYDLTFSSGPAGEHCTMLMGEGKNPGLDHLLKLAHLSSIQKPRALKIISAVKEAVSKWERFAKEAGVTKTSSQLIQETIKLTRI